MSEKKYLDYSGLSEVVDKSKETFQKREFVGTRDEWEDLSASEKAKYGIANFTDDNGNVVGFHYSTTEQKTGNTWIDGKPIYRIVASGVTEYNETNNICIAYIPINVSVETVIDLKGFFATDAASIGFPGVSYQGVARGIFCNRTLQRIEAYWTNTNDRVGITITAIMEYTKTID